MPSRRDWQSVLSHAYAAAHRLADTNTHWYPGASSQLGIGSVIVAKLTKTHGDSLQDQTLGEVFFPSIASDQGMLTNTSTCCDWSQSPKSTDDAKLSDLQETTP